MARADRRNRKGRFNERIRGLDIELFSELIFGLVIGLIFGLFVGLSFGGDAVTKHLILRSILWLNGHMPWNYARFLDYATDRIFLRKVGGGYIFIHRTFLEHLANMSDEDIARFDDSL